MATDLIRAAFFTLLAIFVTTGCNEPTTVTTPKTYTVKILQMKFQPEELWVNQGDTVTFINEDMVAHDVTQQPSASWTSGRLEKGSQWKHVVSESADYYCSLHKVMTGKLQVRTK